MKKLLLSVLILSRFSSYGQKYMGLAETPPMGWNSWNTFKTNFNEEVIEQIADQMVDSKMKDVGYQYIVLDDGWMSMTRDKAGNLVADSVKFPHGIKALAKYIHTKGLKIGIYNCAGTKTCGGYPGSKGFEYQDAQLYASWDIDYLKLDWCNTEGIKATDAYSLMSMAIRKAGRPMIFSICEWGTNQPWLWAADIAQLWRTTQDIYNCFDCLLDHGTWYWAGPMRILDLENDLRKYSGPGHWNDPDMLEVGTGRSVAEDRSHFSMWCMLAAPLIAGNDLRHMSNETLQILTNPEAISIDQDSLGIQGFRYQKKDSLEIWVKPLKDQRWAVAFLNRSAKSKKINYNWKLHSIYDSLSRQRLDPSRIIYKRKDVWGKTNNRSTDESLSYVLEGHDILLFSLSPKIKKINKKSVINKNDTEYGSLLIMKYFPPQLSNKCRYLLFTKIWA